MAKMKIESRVAAHVVRAVLFAILGAAFLIAAGCASAAPAVTEGGPTEPTAQELAERKAAEEKAAIFASALTRNDTGKTVISKVNRDTRFSTSYLILSKSGTAIVADPFGVVPGIRADLIISTHKDYDHNDPVFYTASAVRKSLYTIESFTEKEVAVTGIPASHYGDDFDPLKPSDVIYLIEVDGLRIAFMGDICQTKLNDSQLAALGRVDIVFIIMEDAPSYGYEAKRSLAMLEQLGPSLAFPAHPTPSVVSEIGAALGGVVEAGYRYEIDAAALGSGPAKIVVLGQLPEE